MVQVKIKRKSDELYHSDTFLGEEYDDGLQHYKYIKKKKVNGKWRYYYDKSSNELTTLRKDAADKQKAFEKSWDEYNNDLKAKDLDEARKNLKKNPDGIDNVLRWYYDDNITRHRKQSYGEYGGKGYYMKKEADWAKYDYNKHSKSVRGKVDKYMEKHGKTIVKKLNKTNDRINKAKKWLKKDI